MHVSSRGFIEAIHTRRLETSYRRKTRPRHSRRAFVRETRIGSHVSAIAFDRRSIQCADLFSINRTAARARPPLSANGRAPSNGIVK